MQHRHSAAIDRARECLLQLSSDSLSRRSLHEDNASISSANHHGWLFHGKESGVSIYSSDAVAFDSLGDQELLSTSLPFFRGESTIDGNWRLDDVLATIGSLGARAVWNRQRQSEPGVLASVLSETDFVAQVFVTTPFPVGKRDSVQAVSMTSDSRTALYVATSVEDELVPIGSLIRMKVFLNGWVLKKEGSSPNPVIPEEEYVSADEGDLSWKHNRTRSRHYEPLSHTLPTLGTRLPPILPDVPLNMRPALAHRQSQSRLDRNTSIRRSPNPAAVVPLPCAERETSRIRASYFMKLHPGGLLPASFCNQLNSTVPLQIASLNKYLAAYGFAPHLVSRKGLRLLSEDFQPTAGSYSLIFMTDHHSPDEVEIRFHGQSFGDGHFTSKVLGATSHRIEHDCPFDPTTKSSTPNRPRLSQRMSTPLIAHRKGSLDNTDTADLTGTQGACTLVLAVSAGSTVQVFLEKKPKPVSQSVSHIEKVARAMAEAHRLAALDYIEIEEDEFVLAQTTKFVDGEKELRRAAVVGRACRTALAVQ